MKRDIKYRIVSNGEKFKAQYRSFFGWRTTTDCDGDERIFYTKDQAEEELARITRTEKPFRVVSAYPELAARRTLNE
jgi:hypothetical protein